MTASKKSLCVNWQLCNFIVTALETSPIEDCFYVQHLRNMNEQMNKLHASQFLGSISDVFHGDEFA